MEVKFLSAKNYSNPKTNNGDCILIDTGQELVVYDCGCEEHANRVLQYMKDHKYKKAKLVLSHNDSDHFKGIPFLAERDAISEIYALLLLKYKDDLLNLLDDDRRTRDSVAMHIKEIYDNIASLGGTDKSFVLKDIFKDSAVAAGITIPGPDKDYSLNAVAKAIKDGKSATVDKETIVNAVSTQLSVDFGYIGRKLLLTGDSSFAAIEETVKNHNAIQLPHHGKLEQAESIFEVKNNRTIYYVSDNTGDTNGGSADLMQAHPRGYVIYNTLDGDQVCTTKSFSVTTRVGTYR